MSSIQRSPFAARAHGHLGWALNALEHHPSVQRYLRKVHSDPSLAGHVVDFHPPEPLAASGLSTSPSPAGDASVAHAPAAGVGGSKVLFADQRGVEHAAPHAPAAVPSAAMADGRFRLSEGYRKKVLGSLVYVLQAMVWIYARKFMGSMITWDAPKSIFK